jgi:hypothetical protein
MGLSKSSFSSRQTDNKDNVYVLPARIKRVDRGGRRHGVGVRAFLSRAAEPLRASGAASCGDLALDDLCLPKSVEWVDGWRWMDGWMDGCVSK